MSAVHELPLSASAERTETILRLLTDMQKDSSLPLDKRLLAGQAHRLIHLCRDPAVIRRMESTMRLAQ